MSEEKELGRIKATFLGIEDHGLFTFVLYIDFGHSGQGFGTYDLTYKKYGIKALRKILEAVGVDSWEQLVGHEIWCTRRNGIITKIEAPAYIKGTTPLDMNILAEEKVEA